MQRSTALLAAITLAVLGCQAQRLMAQDKNTDQAIEATLGDAARYRQIIGDLQSALKNHDADAVAAMVSYPISVTIGSKQQTVKSAKESITSYDGIVTPEIVAAVANEPYENLMVNAQGVMLGQGEIWINGICQDSACRKSDVNAAEPSEHNARKIDGFVSR